MILAAGLSLLLSIFGGNTFGPSEVMFTFRFNQPVYGEVCVEATGDELSGFEFRSSCEDLRGKVKQIRWKVVNPGHYMVRATFRGGTERIVTAYQPLVILEPPGWGL